MIPKRRKERIMRVLFISIIGLALTGCGIHSFKSDSTTPEHQSAGASQMGPYGSDASSSTKDTSDYAVCLEQYAGMPGNEAFCQERMWAGRPNQPPTYYGWYGQGGYPGQYAVPPSYLVRAP